MKWFIAWTIILVLPLAGKAQRSIISLNGSWQIEESVEAGKLPAKFLHTVQVPGLINQAVPAFKDVDIFYAKEFVENIWVRPTLDKKLLSLADTATSGYTPQVRKYFWYQKSISLPDDKQVYLLKVGKAQFGTAVWVNGKKVGESFDCFAAQYYDVTAFVKKKGANVFTIRVGAHPGVLPLRVPAGTDFEKQHWTPGMYDDVEVIATNYPYIETVQAAPDIRKNTVTVQTLIVTKPGNSAIQLKYAISEWKEKRNVLDTSVSSQINADGRTLITTILPIASPTLWSPANPFLYKLNVSTGSDAISTRFGMRAFRFETATKRAYLNDSIFYLRGSNITLHRFFDDSLCGNLPWDEQWVRKLLTGLPAKYNWNSFRFCIGPVPDKWLDIADEAGLIIQNEYFIWSYRPSWDSALLKAQVKNWMRDGWNHPSVAWWDVNNETHSEVLTDIIRDVRSLDLSNRAWDNGFNLPQGENDPIEDHHYLMYAPLYEHLGIWKLENFERGTGQKSTNSPHPSAHATVLNEYGWMWLKRNGGQTLLTSATYDSIAPGYTNEQRQALYAYLLAAETEYFRCNRNYAGVLHFDYLTGDFNGAITGDIFKNPVTLEPTKVYDDYLKEMFKPLGMYVNLFRKRIAANTTETIAVMLVNDEYKSTNGTIEMELVDANNKTVATAAAVPFSISGLSQLTRRVTFTFPSAKGEYMLMTYARQQDGKQTLCRRKVNIQ